MNSNLSHLIPVAAGLLVNISVSGLLILLAYLVWTTPPFWIWVAVLLLGAASGGASATRLARAGNLVPGVLVGLIVGIVALALAAAASGFALRATLGGAVILMMAVAGAALGAFLARQRQVSQLLAAILILLMAGAFTVPAMASTPIDPRDLEGFLDETISGQLESLDVPGAAVAVAVDGELLLVRGYGLADRQSGRLVDGGRTLFRTGSAAKPVTATAVMQLVEQGRLDLHADVNDYLDFTIPATFPEPVTLAHLLTHTAGFEDVGESLFVLLEEQLLPLRTYLTQLQPARVFPPGAVQAYSNYGTALAGYIVERTAGEPFDRYVEKYIFAPLQMQHSSLRQPVPDHLRADLAVGYGTGQSRHLPGGFVFMPPYPAGSMSATAADMGRFLIAHLQHGRYQDSAILEPQTVQLMHSRQYASDPRLDGMGYGFMLQEVNGRLVRFHRGSTFQFNAGLYLLPEQGVGLYVVYNGLGSVEAPAQLWQAFMDRYFPMPPFAELELPAGASERLAAYTGEYHLARADFSGPAKLFRLLEAAQITAAPDGALLLMVEGRTERYIEVEPGLYRQDGREAYLAFHNTADGTQWLSLDGQPAFLNFTATSAFRVPWYATLSFSALLILVTLLFLLISNLGWLISAWRGRRKGSPAPRSLRLARWMAAAFALVFVTFLVSFAGIVGDIDPAFGVPRIYFGGETAVDLVLLLPWLLAALAAGLALAVGWAWRTIPTSGSAGTLLLSRLQISVLGLLAVAVIWWLAYWNLLSW